MSRTDDLSHLPFDCSGVDYDTDVCPKCGIPYDIDVSFGIVRASCGCTAEKELEERTRDVTGKQGWPAKVREIFR